MIHGLQGHPYKAWACAKVPKTPMSPAPSRPEASEDGKDKHKNFLRFLIPWHKRESSENAALDMKPGLGLAKSAKGSNGKSPFVFWPADLLPNECPNSRILVYGYDTKITKYMTGATNKNSVFSHSKDLLFALCRERMLDRPLILVAHSLGGIVVKEVGQAHLGEPCPLLTISPRCSRDLQHRQSQSLKTSSIPPQQSSFSGRPTEVALILRYLANRRDLS